jgi:cystathionine beta-lyase
MQYNFDQMPDRRGSESFKWRIYPENVMPLFVADMDFVSPAPVVQAVREYAEKGIFGYPRGLHTSDAAELPELGEAVVARMFERYGWRIAAEDVIFTPGVVPAFNLASHALADEGGAVLVQSPVYPHILSAPRKARLQQQNAELRRLDDGSYTVDWDDFSHRITPETRMFILCNPHNPVGRAFQRDELERMAQICLSRGVVICADEIHSDLVFSGHEHIPIASLAPDVAQRTITLIAPSKTFNLAGLQCAIAIIQNPQLRKKFQAAREGLTPWVNAPGLIAAEAAYRHGKDWLDQLLAYLEGNRDYLDDFVHTRLRGVAMAKPEATYLAWLDFRATGIADPYRFLLEKAQVALSDGHAFGPGGEGFVRLNFGCPRFYLESALGRIAEALAAGS